MFATIKGIPVTFEEFVLVLTFTRTPPAAGRRTFLRTFDSDVRLFDRCKEFASSTSTSVNTMQEAA
jgi:hypothetical protein